MSEIKKHIRISSIRIYSKVQRFNDYNFFFRIFKKIASTNKNANKFESTLFLLTNTDKCDES